MNRGLINRIVELQTRLSRLEGKTYIQFQVVRNNTVPLELLREVIYYNYEANEFIYFNPLIRQSEKISIGSGSGMTFTDLVAMLQEGTNVTLDVDLVNETITINSTVTPTVTYIRRSDYISADRKSYLAFAPSGSLETDAVWTITKRVGSADGTIVSNVQYFDKRWTERGLL